MSINTYARPVTLPGSKDLQNANDKLVAGWKSKLSMGSLNLSKLSPFINLLALYDSKDVTELTRVAANTNKWQQLVSRLKPISIKGTTVNQFSNSVIDDKFNASNADFKSILSGQTSIEFKFVPILGIESQLNTLNQRGGEGITSFSITRGAQHNYSATMSVTITDINIFKDRVELNNLITLNSLFLVSYGWSSSEGLQFTNPPNFENTPNNLSIDLDEINFGYWRAMLFRLYRYNFSFDEVGHMNGTLEFMSPNQGLLSFIKMANISKSVLTNLNDSAKVKTFTDPVSPTTSQAVITHYRLKDVFDQIQTAVHEANTGIPATPSVSTAQIDVTQTQQYQDLVQQADSSVITEKEFTDQVNALELSLKQQQTSTAVPINTASHSYLDLAFEYPSSQIATTPKTAEDFMLNADKVKKIFTNSVASLLDVVRALTDSDIIDSPKGLTLALAFMNNKVSISIIGIDAKKMAQQENVFTIEFGTRGSLCETIDLSSKLDPNAMDVYNLPIIFGDTQQDTAAATTKILTNLGLIGEKADLSSTIAKDFFNFVKLDINSKDISNSDAIIRAQNDTTLLERFIQQNTVRYANVVQASLDENDLFARLMGYYLKQTTITIHGTVGLEPYNAIILKGVIDNLSGIYNITQLTEQLDLGTFSTVIEARLISPSLISNTVEKSTTYDKNNPTVDSSAQRYSSLPADSPMNSTTVEPTNPGGMDQTA